MRVRLMLVLVLSVAAFTSAPVTSACASEGLVKVVIEGIGEGTIEKCVEVSGGTDGLTALQATGLDVTTRDFGGDLGVAVCSIEGVGTSTSACPGAKGHWHYWRGASDAWVEATVGVSSSSVGPGSIEGWVWETDDVSEPPTTAPRPCTAASAPGRTDDRNTTLYAVVAAAVVAAMILLIRLNRSRSTRDG